MDQMYRTNISENREIPTEIVLNESKIEQTKGIDTVPPGSVVNMKHMHGKIYKKKNPSQFQHIIPQQRFGQGLTN